jgi:hypothetical protein
LAIGEDSNHDGDGDFTTIGWDEDYLKAKVELWKTGKGKDPQHYTQSSILRNVNLRSHWGGGARKRINQKGSEPGNAIISGVSP